MNHLKSVLPYLVIALFISCTQQPSPPPNTEAIGVPERPILLSEIAATDESDELMPLPGVERSQFNELSAMAESLKCETSSTGPYYRQQSSMAKQGSINYFSATVTLPTPIYNGNISNKNRIVSTVYTGGDTRSSGGALDVGFAGDNMLGGPYWRAFIKSGVGEWDKDNSDTKLYRIAPNTTVKFEFFVNEVGSIVFNITGSMLEFDRANISTFKNVNITRSIVWPTPANTWSFAGTNQFFKLMTSLAVDNPIDFTSNTTKTAAAAAWSNVILGLRDKNGKITDVKNWENVLYDSGCPTPSDMVGGISNRSASITLRIKSKFDFSFVSPVSPKGKAGDALTNNFIVKNVGPAGSMLYYDFTPVNQPRQREKLTSGKSFTGSAKYTCTSTSETVNQPLDIYYSENETLSANSTLSGLPNPPASLTSYSATAGNLSFKKASYKIPFRCNIRQTFQVNALDITALVNKSATATSVLTVLAADAGQPLTGQFNLALAPAPGGTPTATDLTVQGIVVTAKTDVTPMAAVIQSANNNLTVTGTCGSTPGNFPFTYTITDPTGNTDPTDYTVTLHCLGPKMTVPTPNPLSISANVGSSASGSFSFQNNADATPSGERAPLTYSVSSSGLSVSSTGSPLAGGGTATIGVSYFCKALGSFPGTVSVTSNDPGKPTVVVDVNVVCGTTSSPPQIADSRTTVLAAKTFSQATAILSFTNCVVPPPPIPTIIKNPLDMSKTALTPQEIVSGCGPLHYNITGTGKFSSPASSGTLAPGGTASVQIAYDCQSNGKFNETININSDDPIHSIISLPVTITCDTFPKLLLSDALYTGAIVKQGDNFYKRSFIISNLTGVKTNYSLTVFGSDVTLPKNISGTSSTIEDIGIIFDINCYYTDFDASKPRISKFNVSVQFNDINNSTQYTLSKTYEVDCTRSKIEFFGLLDPKTNSVIPVIKGDPLRLDGIITGNIFPVSSGVSAVNVSITSKNYAYKIMNLYSPGVYENMSPVVNYSIYGNTWPGYLNRDVHVLCATIRAAPIVIIPNQGDFYSIVDTLHFETDDPEHPSFDLSSRLLYPLDSIATCSDKFVN